MSLKSSNKVETNRYELEIEIAAEDFEKAVNKAFKKNVRKISVPGFRKGKAPMQMVEKQYGTEIFHEDTFNELVPDIFDAAIKENNIQAVSQPDIDITQIGKGKDLIFTAVVQVKPEIKLGKYKGIELEKIEYNVSDHDIEHELGQVLKIDQ